MLKFAWDEAKAAANLAKHGVSFEEAATVFGMSEKSRALLVVNMERGRTIRIISARKATKHERGIYEQA